MKGVLMRPDMIQATIEGRKTHTRWAEAGLREINQDPNGWNLEWFNPDSGIASFSRGDIVDGVIEITDLKAKSRYQQGETVYLKEAWALTAFPIDCWHVLYKDGQERRISPREAWLLRNKDSLFGKWRTPLFMPEWAARHFLKILAVRAERLQEIISEDCQEEGIKIPAQGDTSYYIKALIEEFRRLWNSINPKYPWESNPWVFPYEFEFVKGDAGSLARE